MVAKDRFCLLGPAKGAVGSLRVAKLYQGFLQRGGAIFKGEYNFLSVPNRQAKSLREDF